MLSIFIITGLLIIFFSMFRKKAKEITKHTLPLDNQKTIFQLINIIGENNEVASNMVSIGGTPSRQWLSFNLLLHLCDVDDFITMTESTIGSIRVYGCFGLICNNHVDLNIIKKKLLSDYSWVNTFDTCIKGRSTVARCIKDANQWIDYESTRKFIQNISSDNRRRNRLIEDLVNEKFIHLY